MLNIKKYFTPENEAEKQILDLHKKKTAISGVSFIATSAINTAIRSIFYNIGRKR